MTTTKATTKKAPATGGKKAKRRHMPPRPMYPDSYVYARGYRSSWRSNERNA
jgi:hypothetical protein